MSDRRGAGLLLHGGEQWEQRCSGLPARSRGQQHGIRTGEERCHGLVLQGSQCRPAEGVDHVVLDHRVQQVETTRLRHAGSSSSRSRTMSSTFVQLVAIPLPPAAARSKTVGQLNGSQGQGVMDARVEVGNWSTRSRTSATSFLRKIRGATPTWPPELPCDSVGKRPEQSRRGPPWCAPDRRDRCRRRRGHVSADQARRANRGRTPGSRIRRQDVEASLGGEVRGEPLGERWEARHSPRARQRTPACP